MAKSISKSLTKAVANATNGNTSNGKCEVLANVYVDICDKSGNVILKLDKQLPIFSEVDKDPDDRFTSRNLPTLVELLAKKGGYIATTAHIRIVSTGDRQASKPSIDDLAAAL